MAYLFHFSNALLHNLLNCEQKSTSSRLNWTLGSRTLQHHAHEPLIKVHSLCILAEIVCVLSYLLFTQCVFDLYLALRLKIVLFGIASGLFGTSYECMHFINTRMHIRNILRFSNVIQSCRCSNCETSKD